MLSKDGDGNEKVLKNNAVLYTWCISLPFLTDYEVKMPYFIVDVNK